MMQLIFNTKISKIYIASLKLHQNIIKHSKTSSKYYIRIKNKPNSYLDQNET